MRNYVFMTFYHFFFENNNICLFMIHCQKNTYCNLCYYCYRKTLYLHECKKNSNQIKSHQIPCMASPLILNTVREKKKTDGR